VKRLPVMGLPPCPYCHERLWSPATPNVEGRWLVLYCGCTDGRYHEYSLQYLANRGIWPVPQAGQRIEDMSCPNCDAPRVAVTLDTAVAECSKCGAKFHVTPVGLKQVLP